MEILLDTPLLLWWLADDARLSGKARQQIADPANTLIVSAATAWEVAIKQTTGKVKFEGEFEEQIKEQGFGLLPITFPHAAEVWTLPAIHRDPVDRMLVAQARVENVQLLTADPHILRYPANVIEA